MASFNKFNSFVEALAEEKHDFENDQLAVALCAAANAPGATDSVLADLTEISYANCSSRNITTASSGQTGGTQKVVCNDLTLSASGGSVGPFRYVVIFNDSAPSDELIGYYDYGSEITLGDGEDLLIDFDASNGFLQIA
jgi:hypothetical protein